MQYDDGTMPRTFVMNYQKPGWSRYISFTIYREPERASWNGYYKGCRIRLWFTGDYWTIAGYVGGIETAYFRTAKTNADMERIQELVQCACFFIDITKKKEIES